MSTGNYYVSSSTPKSNYIEHGDNTYEDKGKVDNSDKTDIYQ